MANPLFDGFMNHSQPQSQQSSGSNSLFGMIQQVKNSPNPNAAMQQILSSNPQFQNVVNYINQNGGDAKTAFYNMAAQKGIDPNSILSKLR